MGIFSFKRQPEPERVVETPLGPFTLAYSKEHRNIWTNRTGRLAMSVRGTESRPDAAQLEFIGNIDAEIEKLNEKISNKFIEEFREADMEIDFSNWEQRFKLVEVQVTEVLNNKPHWTITFEDLKEPYAQFSFLMEGDTITDYYIDT